MRTVWVHRHIDAADDDLWALLTTPSHWPEWGPTVREAELHGDEFDVGATGVVTTVGGLRLPFVLTAVDEGARWAWKVGRVPATDHTIESLSPSTCRVGFGVPWPAAPYLAVCQWALRRLDALATTEGSSS